MARDGSDRGCAGRFARSIPDFTGLCLGPGVGAAARYRDPMSSEAVPQPSNFVPDAATELLLIRHGRSADVVPDSEESLDPPLHVVGHEQAKALGRRLAPDRKRLDAVYASDLRRAVDTAFYLASP
jgi:hypothetical protein